MIDCAIESSAPPPRPWITRNSTSSGSEVARPHRNDADREDGDRRHEVASPSEAPGEPARHRDHDHVGDDVARDDPGDLVDRRAQVPHHVRERHVHDRRVEDLEDRRQHHAEQHQALARARGATRGRRLCSWPPRRAQWTRTTTFTERPTGSVASARSLLAAAVRVDAVDRDLHRHALHDLGEVPGGVVGREQRVLRARGGRDGFHVTAPAAPGEGVDADLRAVARLDATDLGLLEVRDHPVVGGRGEREQRLPGRDVGARLDALLADDPVERRRDDRVGERELRLP